MAVGLREAGITEGSPAGTFKLGRTGLKVPITISSVIPRGSRFCPGWGGRARLEESRWARPRSPTQREPQGSAGSGGLVWHQYVASLAQPSGVGESSGNEGSGDTLTVQQRDVAWGPETCSVLLRHPPPQGADSGGQEGAVPSLREGARL